MTKMILSLALTLISSAALANDGGMAAIKVDQIKMRETAIKDGALTTVKKIAKPSYEITFEGGEAAKLQKVLPSQTSVITAMQPEIAKAYDESFKALGIYSEKSGAASSKTITISCSDATLDDVAGPEYKVKVTKTGKSVCTITIEGNDDDAMPELSFGDMIKFEPKTCK